LGSCGKEWDVFWESNPTNIKSPSGECFAGDGNTLATGGEGIFKLGEGLSIRGERLAEGGERLAEGGERLAEGGEGLAEGGEGLAEGGGRIAKGGGGVAAARWGSAPLSLFASRQTAGDELAHLRDFGLGEQLEGGGFVGCDDWLAWDTRAGKPQDRDKIVTPLPEELLVLTQENMDALQ
jgi:hypothetical protein